MRVAWKLHLPHYVLLPEELAQERIVDKSRYTERKREWTVVAVAEQSGGRQEEAFDASFHTPHLASQMASEAKAFEAEFWRDTCEAGGERK